MPVQKLTKKQIRQYMFLKQGLIDNYKFAGKHGILEFIHQAGCIQFDPIDVCGKNAELVLQSRVKGFKKSMLYELLYTERELLDYFDKNLSIIPVGDWKYFERERERHCNGERSYTKILAVSQHIKNEISRRGPICSADLNMKEKVSWYWSDTKLSRAALEHLYFSGKLAVHHKKGSIKYYDLIENCVPAGILSAPDPYPDDIQHRKWRVFRRIGAVGLLWNRGSDAWLCIPGLKSKERNEAFDSLLSEGAICEVRVEGIPDLLYCCKEDVLLINYIASEPKLKSRCEFMAPLDNMIWDRKLIRALFDFDYKWEIYTPESERKYGYYVLPIIFGECFIGRLEAVYDRKNKKLNVKNIWYEDEIKVTKSMANEVSRSIERLELFNRG